MMDIPLKKGHFPDRNTTALIIACEMKRIGQDFDTTRMKLNWWNRSNEPPLRLNELEKAANNAYHREYNYGCKNPVLEDFCVGWEICPFKNRVKSKVRRVDDMYFHRYRWPEYLSNRQVLIYQVALKYLEKRQQVGFGGTVYANHKQIAEACGISPGRIGHDLKVLNAVGLIDYQVGIPRKWEGMASEIRRILPIPKPSRKAMEILKEFKKDAC